MKQKSWISIVFSFASQCRGKIALSVLCAIISVVAGLIPYWSVYQIITLFIGGSPVMAEVWKWCWIGLGAYAIRFLLYGISTSLSHISAYTILENIRLTLAQRLMKAPLGTVIGESVGKLKSVLVDRVETIELPLAHMIPECISNLLLPMRTRLTASGRLPPSSASCRMKPTPERWCRANRVRRITRSSRWSSAPPPSGCASRMPTKR